MPGLPPSAKMMMMYRLADGLRWIGRLVVFEAGAIFVILTGCLMMIIFVAIVVLLTLLSVAQPPT